MIPHHTVDGSGETIVLLNSLGATLDMWQPQVVPLSTRFRLVRLDFRGHGGTPFETGADPARLSVDDLARDVLDLLDHLGIGRAHVVGVSLGGVVGMRLAYKWGDRLLRLALVSTAAKIGTAEGWQERADLVRAAGCAAVSGPAMDRWFSPAFLADHPETVAGFRERFDACDPEGYAACCEALGRTDLREQVPEMYVPSIVLSGTEDEVTTVADAAFLEERLPNARKVLAEGAKHLLTTERADWTNRILASFFREFEVGVDL